MRKKVSAGFRSLALLLGLIVVGDAAEAAGLCKLVPNDAGSPGKVLHCGDNLTIKSAAGARYQLIYQRREALPTGARLDSGALLIEFHPSATQSDFQILTPLAIAAVRGTRWAMDVAKTRTSTLVLAGAVAVTSRPLNQYVVLTAGQGVDITATDKTLVQKQWGQARVRELLSRFGE